MSSAPKHFSSLEPDRAEYLASALPEEVIDPARPIIDTHHHLWDVKGALEGKLDGRDHRYMVDEFAADAGTGHNVAASVFVECRAMYRADGPIEMRPVGEVTFIAGLAAMSESGRYGPTRVAAGIVGHADLTLGDRVAPVLEAEILAGGSRFRGVRYMAGWSDDPTVRSNATATGPGLYRSATFHAGVHRLARLGLSFDAMVFHPQLDDVAVLAAACPDCQVVLGHCGAPLGSGRYASARDEVFAAWKLSMTRLAQLPNVAVKLGGMTIRLAAFDFRNIPRPPSSAELAEMWGPYIGTCIELFGPGRCMFESNFPVDKMGLPYRTLWNGFKRITASASEDEKQMLFSGNARRVYKLPAADAAA